MKQLVCDMCGSTDLIKQDGVFVCQNCGCKYSVEEAKKMMVEGTVEIQGTVEVQGTVKVDSTDSITTFLEMSESALNGSNGQSALDYANKALEIDPRNVKAWLLRMGSIQYLGTMGDLRLREMVEAGGNAISYAGNDKEEIENTVYSYYLQRALDLLKLITVKISDTEDIRSTYNRLMLVSLLTVNANCHKADQGVIKIYENVGQQAIALPTHVPEDAMGKYKGLPDMLREIAGQYQAYTDELQKRYSIYGSSLTKQALDTRKNTVTSFKERAQKGEESGRKYRQQRIEEYWSNHIEEKHALTSEVEQLKGEIVSINTKIKSIEDQEFQLQSKQVVDEINNKIDKIQKEMNSLGLFKGKEKKALQAEIDELKVEREKAEEAYNIDKEAIRNQTRPLFAEKKKRDERIDEISKELTKDR